jgi:polyhydroxyalkanoate synthase subunit PhaC
MQDVLENLSRTARWTSLISGEQTVEVGRTPREVVYQRDLLTLYRYRGAQAPTVKTPILIVYSLINRPYILDLLPGRSVIEKLVSDGFDVFLLDWGVPSSLDRYAGLDTYVNLYLRTAVRQVCKVAEVEQVSLFGYCMGGTMSAMFTALHPHKVQSLVLLGAPFHFRSNELLYRWGCDRKTFDPQAIVDACGVVPPWAFEGFSLLKFGQKVPRLAQLYDLLDDDKTIENHLAMEQWVGDNIPMAGAVYAEFTTRCFLDNDLIEGRVSLGGRRIDLASIACPTLIITGDSDHLVPCETSAPLAKVIARPTLMPFKAGHIGLSVSGGAHKKLWPEACAWLRAQLHGPESGACNVPATPTR